MRDLFLPGILFPERRYILRSTRLASGPFGLRQGAEQLQRRLPAGWSVGAREAPGPKSGLDGVYTVTAPDGRAAELAVQVQARLDPRRAAEVAPRLRAAAAGRPAVVVSAWLSAPTRDRLQEQGVHVIDLSGNIRVAVSDPGLYVEAAGAEQDPEPEGHRVTLRGVLAGRLVRTLAAAPPPLGIRALAAAVGGSPGYTSKVVAELDAAGAVDRGADGKVQRVHLRRLLTRWAEEAPLERRAQRSAWLDPRGLSALLRRLPAWEGAYAITGSLAAARLAPIAPPRLASVWVGDPAAFARGLGLRPADAGANVLLLVPEDPRTLDEVEIGSDGLRYAVRAQVVADLLSGPGRSPEEAEAVLEVLMAEDPEIPRE